MASTLTRAHIADELYRTIGLSHNESAELVEMFFEEILLCFEKGEEVKLTSFGTFKIRNFDAIIFPGQTYILAIGQMYEDVLVSKGKITTSTFMDITLSCDHRAVDGVLASKFLTSIVNIMEVFDV